MNKLKTAFFGSPDFSARLLEQLLTDSTHPFEIVSVFTQPDKKAGRDQALTPTPVKHIAKKYDIPISDLRSQMSDLDNVDVAILYAYGKLLPEDILTKPKYGFLNIHPSLLPRYRGVAPMAFALLMGETKTGVTLIKLDNEMDHGPIIAQEEYTIQPTDKSPDLENNLTDLAFTMIKNVTAAGLDSSTTPQNEELATYTRFLTKNDGFIPFEVVQKLIKNEHLLQADLPHIIMDYYERNPNEPIENLKFKIKNSPKTFYDLFRGLYPWPGLWTFLTIDGQQKRLKITEAAWLRDQMVIEKVQLEGRNEVDFETFRKANPSIF
jgi:methionyl-tRNA formyltransferase